MGCCNSTANSPSSDVVGESATAKPVTVATSHLVVREHSSDTPYRSRGRTPSAHHPTYRRTARPYPSPRNRMLSASQEMNPTGLKSSMKAQTSLRPSRGSCSGPIHTITAGTRSLTSTVRHVLSDHHKFRILVVGKRGSGKSSLVNAVFEVKISVAPGKRDINHEIHPENNRYLIVHETSGFGLEDGQNLQAIRDFISYRTGPSCSDAEKLHAVWICVPTSDAINENIGEGIEEILGMKRVPIVVAFTKFDEAVAPEGFHGSIARTDARTQVEQSCHSLFRGELSDVPAEIVSVRSPFRDLIDNLVVTTGRFFTGPRTASANSSQLSARGREPLIAPVPLVWSAALRVNRIQASIEIGQSRHWCDLLSSVYFADQPLMDCLNVIHEDIVEIWNLNDRTRYLSGTEFKKKMSHNVKDLVGSLSGAPSSDGPVDWISDVYRGSQQNVRCVMAYVVDLIVILGDMFRIAGNNVSANDAQSAMNRHVSSGRRDRIHRDIRSFVTETFATRPRVPQRDLVLEKIVELIRQYCASQSAGD